MKRFHTWIYLVITVSPLLHVRREFIRIYSPYVASPNNWPNNTCYRVASGLSLEWYKAYTARNFEKNWFLSSNLFQGTTNENTSHRIVSNTGKEYCNSNGNTWWEKYCNTVCNNCSSCQYNNARLGRHSQELLDYASSVWHYSITRAQTEQLESIQKEQYISVLTLPVACHTPGILIFYLSLNLTR